METAVMSARCDKHKLEFADKLAQKQYGVSFAKYCGTVVLDQAFDKKSLPKSEKTKTDQQQKDHENLMRSIREIGENTKHPEIGEMSGDEIKDLIASRYL